MHLITLYTTNVIVTISGSHCHAVFKYVWVLLLQVGWRLHVELS